MKIGVLSDTHGSYIQTKKALEALGDCDYLLHLGDVLYHGPRNPVYATYEPAKLAEFLVGRDITFIKGNCDADVDNMVTQQDLSNKEALLHWGDVVIYAVHGYEETLEERLDRAKSLGANTVLFGHSHLKSIDQIDGLTVINPGSTTLPKDGSCSCALYENGQWSLISLSDAE